MVRVKICGITSIDDALLAVEAGADALGFVFHEKSPRAVSPEQAATIIDRLPPFVAAAGVFVDAEREFVNHIAERCRLDIVQLHGEETPDYCTRMTRRVVKAFRVKDMESLAPMGEYRVAGYLLDAYSPVAFGGTGLTFNWEAVKVAEQFGPIIMAGGLTPDNVRQAVERVSPYGVDVSSGVEAFPGKKDPDKVRAFIRRAKGW